MVNPRKAGDRLAHKLGANIAARRRARRWSQEDLAERLAVAPETISRFERGATLPSLSTLQRIGQTLKSPVADLLAGSSPEPDDQAAVISTWIAGLTEDDREYVLDVVKMTCDHLRRKR